MSEKKLTQVDDWQVQGTLIRVRPLTTGGPFYAVINGSGPLGVKGCVTLNPHEAAGVVDRLTAALSLPDLAQMQRRVEEIQKQRDAAVSAIVYLTENYGGKVSNATYAECPALGELIYAETKRWEREGK